MFLRYELIRELKTPGIALVRDEETGMLAVRKDARSELRPVYERLRELKHKNLPEIYAIEELEDRLVVFYAYAEGVTLKAVMERGGCTEREAAGYMEELCSALGALHSLKPPVIHRDVKPSNIIIASGANAHLTLIDFDAARVYREGLDNDTELIGTRGYAAPEQYGFLQSDERTDIYAAGIVLRDLMEVCGAKEAYANVIKTSTNISPDLRYKSAARLSRAIRAVATRRPRRVAIISAAAVAVVAVMVVAVSSFCAAKPVQAEAAMPTVAPTVAATAAPTVAPTVVPTPIPERKTLQEYCATTEMERYNVSTEAELMELIVSASAENPGVYYEINLAESIELTKSASVLPNTRIIVPEGLKLSTAPGITLTNSGRVFVDYGAELVIGENGTLCCGECIDDENKKTLFRPCVETEGVLRVGKGGAIARDSQNSVQGSSPLVQIYGEGELIFDNPASAKFTRGLGCYVYIAMYRSMAVDVKTRDLVELAAVDGARDAIRCECRIYSMPDLYVVIDEERYKPFSLMVAFERDIMLSENEKIELPSNINIIIMNESVITIPNGASLSLPDRSWMEIFGDAHIAVQNGGHLHVGSLGLNLREDSGNGHIIANDGAEVTFTYDGLRDSIGVVAG